jgi:hypothetical protein
MVFNALLENTFFAAQCDGTPTPRVTGFRHARAVLPFLLVL